MRNSIYRFTLDMYDLESQVQIVAKKGDNARKIYVSLMEDGKPYAIETGCRAVLSMNKPDGNILYNDCYIIDSGRMIAYDFTEQTTSVEGICDCEIKLYGTDDEVITAPRFTIFVSDTVYEDGQIESTSEFTGLTQAIADINRLDVDANKEGKVATLTVTKKDGTEKTVEIVDGIPGITYSETEPQGIDRTPIWINPIGGFIPIPSGGSGGGSDIDDSQISLTTTYSSQKIVDTLDSYKSEFVTPTQLEEAIGGALNGTY